MSDDDKFNDEEYHFIDDPDMAPMDDASLPGNTDPAVAPSDVDSNPKRSEYMNKTLDMAAPVLDALKNNFALRLTVLGFVILVLVLTIYRCTSGSVVPKKSKEIASIPVEHSQSISTSQPTRRPIVIEQPQNTSHSVRLNMSDQRLAAIEQSQTDLQTHTSALTAQLSSINTNVNVMTDNMKALSEQLSQLAAVVQEQAKQAADLNQRLKQQSVKQASAVRSRLPAEPSVRYFLQAVIPGRAWLVNTNGDTLTVREGTRIASYGVIRYIDAKRGQVLTSSGQVIKFSQNDS